MATSASSYLLIFRETAPERYDALSQAERREAMRRWNDWCDQLAAQEKFQHGHPLEPTARVVSGARAPRAIDGPFTEAKELIAGYFLLAADSLDAATAIAEQCPFLRYGMTVEVRPIAQACHLARSLGWQTMREPADA